MPFALIPTKADVQVEHVGLYGCLETARGIGYGWQDMFSSWNHGLPLALGSESGTGGYSAEPPGHHLLLL
jgi:hypothetical protein